MSNLKVIKSIEQYHKYCNELEELTSLRKLTAEHEEKIDLQPPNSTETDDEQFISIFKSERHLKARQNIIY